MQKQLCRFRLPTKYKSLSSEASTSALSLSPAVFPHQASISQLAPQLSPTAHWAGTASALVRQAVPSTQPTQDSTLAFFAKEKADLKEALNSHKPALVNSKNALEEESRTCRAIVSALQALQELVQHLKAENAFLKECNHELMPKNLPVPHNVYGKILDQLFASIPTGLLGISLKIDQRLASLLA